ncbi:hypothetical protein AFLA_002941 [Aspergillus flavus NRRL3357]|nr:hypothetical protein AFLA_002941 [Aspergillus flavus NRRL3357]
MDPEYPVFPVLIVHNPIISAYVILTSAGVFGRSTVCLGYTAFSPQPSLRRPARRFNYVLQTVNTCILVLYFC